MEDLASVTEDSSQGDRLNQSKKAPIAETKVPVPTVNIASYSLRPGILISTLTIP